MNDLAICIAGWSFIADIYKIAQSFDSHAVCHREGDTLGTPSTVIKNRGLEWHKYDHYIKQVWNGKSDIFFFQDDIRTILRPADIRDLHKALNKGKIDQAFFSGEGEIVNTNDEWQGHGRFFYLSKKLTHKLLQKRTGSTDKNVIVEGFEWLNYVIDTQHIKRDWASGMFMDFLSKNMINFKVNRHYTFPRIILAMCNIYPPKVK